MGRFRSIVAFNSSFLLATFRTFRTFGLLFYVVLLYVVLLCPTSALSGVIAIVRLFIIAIYFYDNFYHGSQ